MPLALHQVSLPSLVVQPGSLVEGPQPLVEEVEVLLDFLLAMARQTYRDRTLNPLLIRPSVLPCLILVCDFNLMSKQIE